MHGGLPLTCTSCGEAFICPKVGASGDLGTADLEEGAR